ncbi:MAG: RND transporter [Gammaproteobacteria bacterium HGW-Gammaproteobacteria-10]|nr:MAG: RND transporter [Gammaproteobacteria bacterium HGW-Gammaproteobacteria-3]PKM35793.1 MAG: RND transporter [Gammaproteobacteria bacterium HGW-Gammaproteobacteria-10]
MQKKSLVSRLALMTTDHPWWILFLVLIALALASAGIAKLGFKSDYRVFFSPENPQLQAFNSIQDTYNKSDNVLFVIEPEAGDVFDPSVLQAIVELTKKSWQIAFASRVDSITNFQHTKAEGDDLMVADLVTEPAALTEAQIQALKTIALNEPLLVNRLSSKTGHVAGVNVTVQLPDKSPWEAMEVAANARQIAAEIEARYPHVKLHLTGAVMMNNAFIESPFHDNTTLVPIMTALVIAVLWFSLHSITATFCVILIIVFSISAALGLFAWQGSVLSQASAPAPIIILTMTVADCVHFLVKMLHNMRMSYEKKTAIQESLKTNFQPMLLTSVTTAIGFLSLNFSDAPPYRDLGNIVAMGVVIAFFLTVTFLPALTCVLPIRVNLKGDLNNVYMKHLAAFVIRRRKPLLLVNGLAAIVFTCLTPLNELNDELVKYFDETVDFRQATDFLNDNMSGMYTVEFAIHSGDAGGINEPGFLRKIDQMAQWLRQQPETVHVNTISDTFKRLNKNMHGDDDAWYKLPEQRDLAAQYLLLYEMSLPYGLDLNDQVNIDKSATRVIATLHNLSSIQMLALEERIIGWLKTNLPELKIEMASPGLMFSHIGKRNIGSLLLGTLLALVFISLILVAAFRSWRLGLISLIPNLVPAGVSFGLWGLIDGQINLGVSIVAGMTLGIVVDDTVHFISKYRQAKIVKSLNNQDAIRYAFSTVGVAMWITSAVLIAGFLVLNFSHFTVNSEMGLLTAITISVALFMDLLFLPPLLLWLDKKD